MILGIDVGEPQGYISLSDYHTIYNQGRRFLIARCQEGLGPVDPRYASNIAGASTAGLVCGAYFPLHPDLPGDAQAEAHFASCKGLGFAPGSLAPWCDSELSRGQSPVGVLGATYAWCLRARELWGRKPTLYTYPWFLADVLGKGGDLAPLASIANLALASYQAGIPLPPVPWTAATMLFQQDSGGQAAPGVTVYRVPNGCPADTDRFLGSDEDFANACDPAKG